MHDGRPPATRRTALRRAAIACALAMTSTGAALAGADARAPSFDCVRTAAGGIARLVCDDAALSALDRRLAEAYAAARTKAANEHPPTLAATQRGWIKGRDDCWKADDRRACVEEAYRLRTAELQARYRLLPPTATARYLCGGGPADEVVAVYFPTDPPSAVVERGDSVSMMFLQRSASGARYAGPNESLWEHQGEARVQWGFGAPEMTCARQP